MGRFGLVRIFLSQKFQMSLFLVKNFMQSIIIPDFQQKKEITKNPNKILKSENFQISLARITEPLLSSSFFSH